MRNELNKTIQKSVLFLGLIFAISLFTVQKSYGEAAIIVGDDVKIKFGVLFQPQIDEAQNISGNYQQNMFLKRARFLIGGQLAPNLTFFTEFDNPNLGKQGVNTPTPIAANKNIATTGFNTLDAILTWKPIDPVNIDTGLIWVPLCRNCIESAAMLLPIGYADSSFKESAATGSNTSRDTGIQLRSYLFSDKLEIRLGAFQGSRSPIGAAGSTDPFRVAGRVQYNVFDAEKGFFYTGTYLGKKKVLAIGAGFDAQGDYRAQAFDLFADIPVTGDLAVTVQADSLRWMPGQFSFAGPAANGDQSDWVVEAGIYHAPTKLMPFAQAELQQDVAGVASNTKILQGGIAYYFSGYNGNLKLSGGYKDTGVVYTNQVTVQLQGFYF